MAGTTRRPLAVTSLGASNIGAVKHEKIHPERENWMSTLLCLDTSTERLLVGLRQIGSPDLDQWITLDAQGNHAAQLIPAIRDLLGDTVPIGLGVTLGPGSFTGLRIGLATAKGLAEGWKIPLLGLDNLAAMAETRFALSSMTPQMALPAIDARKGKFYGAIYQRDKVLCPPMDLSPHDWIAKISSLKISSIEVTGVQGVQLAALWTEVPFSLTTLNLADWTRALLHQTEDGWAHQNFLSGDAGPRYLRQSEAEELLNERNS